MDFQSESNIDLSPTIKRTMHDGIEGESTQKRSLDTNVNIEIQDADIHDATMGVDHLKPVVGMTFKSFQEACDFYNQYAKIVGFGMKVKRSWFTDDGVALHDPNSV
ncbi:uncharacterized protein A4U43_C03F6010 [Asparagus officinalis]|uniref:Protein FAR1-RELATED SEQUENCE n=1 Tax=Asparagus officinalis TaxID=4686 RepID=A0A5P1F7S0_ASPOF|nr:uncharacterized protein LOC109834644 [Asparagus officinalis]ONK74418.1 uncharacterized protein A4U43_C03F6010 [Asparagus officinalis]